MYAIEVDGLTKTYPGGVEAVKALHLDVAPGEVFGLLGPNGAGKSTTVGMLTTTVAPTAGSARLAGFDVARQSLAARCVSSVVFQEPVVDRALTGRAHLELHARLWGVTRARADAATAELVEALGLSELVDRPVGTYSGGERRRLEIARALTSEPRVLFLDEPTVGLDPRIRHELLDVIAGLRVRREMTILLTTHYLDEAQRLCDRVAIMNRPCATTRPHRRSPPSTPPTCAPRASRPAPRRSTTSTCASPATSWSRRHDRHEGSQSNGHHRCSDPARPTAGRAHRAQPTPDRRPPAHADPLRRRDRARLDHGARGSAHQRRLHRLRLDRNRRAARAAHRRVRRPERHRRSSQRRSARAAGGADPPLVVALFAAAFIPLAVRAFNRAALR